MVQKGATASELRKTSCPTQPASLLGLSSEENARASCRLPSDGSRCLNSSSCRRTDSRTTFLLSFCSFSHHLYFFLSSLAVIKVICLIQDMSQRNSKACDAGLAFDFARTLGPTAADGGWRDASRSLPRSCFSRPSVTFPFRLCYRDFLASAHLLPEPGGYPD